MVELAQQKLASVPERFHVLLRRVERRVVDGEHAVRLRRRHRAEDVLGPI
jgi:hypothetical protein